MNLRKLVFALSAVVIIIGIVLAWSTQVVEAETIILNQATCTDKLEGSWVADTCTVSGFSIGSDDLLIIDPGITIINNGAITNNGIIDVNGGHFLNVGGDISNNGTVNNSGIIDNKAVLLNHGIVSNSCIGTINGSITNIDNGVINNDSNCLLAISALGDEVRKLADGEALDNNQATELLNRLENSAEKLEAGDMTPALWQLGGFANQVKRYINEGSLSPEAGQSLIDTAIRIVNALSG